VTDRFLEPWRYPAPYRADEDPASLVVRMAVRGSMSVKQFTDSYLLGAGSGVSNVITSDRMLTRLAVIAGVEPEALRFNALSVGHDRRRNRPEAHGLFRGSQLPRGTISTQKRIAPGAMKSDGEDPYVRLGWRFQVLPADPQTGEVLITRCLQCSRHLRWDTPHVCLCAHCGFDVRQAPPVFLADGELVATRTLAGALGLNGDAPKPLSLQYPFSELSLMQQLPVLAWLAGFRGLLDGTRLSATPTNIHLGLPLAEGWQETLQQIVLLVFRQTAGQGDHIVRDLVGLFKTIPGNDLRCKIIEQVAALASAPAASHRLTNYLDSWQTAPYTTLARGAQPPQPKKRSSHRRRRSKPAGSIR